MVELCGQSNKKGKTFSLFLFSCIIFPWKWTIMIPVKPNNINFHWILLFMLSFILSALLSQFWSVFYFSPEARYCKTARLMYILFFRIPLKKTAAKKVNFECKQPPKIMYYNNVCCKIIKLSYSFVFLKHFWCIFR